jgi:hypothetical protein
MEDILDLYQRPYNPHRPLICLDEQPVQLIQDTREPIAAKPGQPKKVDYEYERNGTASIFMHTEPLGSWRQVSVRSRRTKKDWAWEIKDLLEIYYPNAERIILVCDNLNTHRLGSLYETFSPEEARKLARRLEIHYTPKHGSWLNIAEIELSALTKQCLNRRIGDITILASESQAWEKRRNEEAKNVDWQFTAKDARIRLKRLYPLIQS